MSKARTLVIGAAVAIAASLLSLAPAHAGGAPDLGVVTVDPVAVFSGDTATLTGTYTCTYPGSGTIGFELLLRGGASTQEASFPAECDGSVHAWRTTTRGDGMTPGPATFWGHLEVCDANGDCPWNLVEERVTLRPVP